MKSESEIRDDFDRIAILPPGFVDRGLRACERQLLRFVNEDSSPALDVGCGTGGFARELAKRCDRVVAIDLSPEMIRIARAASRGLTIDYRIAALEDVLMTPNEFGCISAIAVLHHVDVRDALRLMVRALKPGGTLLIVDLLERNRLRDLPINAIAWLLTQIRELTRSKALRAAWQKHGEGERYLLPDEVRSIYRELLPGCTIHLNLLWRYSVVWRKP